MWYSTKTVRCQCHFKESSKGKQMSVVKLLVLAMGLVGVTTVGAMLTQSPGAKTGDSCGSCATEAAADLVADSAAGACCAGAASETFVSTGEAHACSGCASEEACASGEACANGEACASGKTCCAAGEACETQASTATEAEAATEAGAEGAEPGSIAAELETVSASE